MPRPLITYLSAWDEIHDVFGDGHEYDWALEGDDEAEYEERLKPEMKYQDVCSIIYPAWPRVDTCDFSGLRTFRNTCSDAYRRR